MKSILNIHWKDWCWSCNSNTLATWCEELTHLKRPWCWERFGQEEKGMTDDEMVGWHHRLNRYDFEQVLGVGNRQGSLAYCSSGVAKCRTWLRVWNELNWESLEKNLLINSTSISLLVTVLFCSVRLSKHHKMWLKFGDFLKNNNTISLVLHG